MTERLHHLAAGQGLVFTRRQARETGMSEDRIRLYLRRGIWERVRRGVYIDAAVWRSLDPADRHLARIHACQLTLASDAVISHHSAAVVNGWDVWDVPLDTICVTRDRPQHSRTEAGVHHFLAPLARNEVVEIKGIRATSPERTLVDLSRTYSFEQAVVVADSAIRAGADREAAAETFLRQARWPGARHALAAIEFADGRSESVGESRLRVLCHRRGLPKPVVQAPISGADGRLIARGDLLFRSEHTLGEFDGKLKYGLELAPGVDPREALFREKLREDAIREEAGLEVVRVTWSDLDHPERTEVRFRSAFARAAARRTRTA